MLIVCWPPSKVTVCLLVSLSPEFSSTHHMAVADPCYPGIIDVHMHSDVRATMTNAMHIAVPMQSTTKYTNDWGNNILFTSSKKVSSLKESLSPHSNFVLKMPFHSDLHRSFTQSIENTSYVLPDSTKLVLCTAKRQFYSSSASVTTKQGAMRKNRPQVNQDYWYQYVCCMSANIYTRASTLA